MKIFEEHSSTKHVYHFKSILEQLLTTMGIVFLDGDNAMAILGTLLEPYEKFIMSFNGQNTLVLQAITKKN